MDAWLRITQTFFQETGARESGETTVKEVPDCRCNTALKSQHRICTLQDAQFLCEVTANLPSGQKQVKLRLASKSSKEADSSWLLKPRAVLFTERVPMPMQCY